MIMVADQPKLFNTDTKEIYPSWIDPNQPLKVPVNPLHYEAHKLQVLLARLDRQAETNPAQFNSTNYINTLDRFTKLCEAINTGKNLDEVLGSDDLASNGNGSAADAVGEGNTSSMGVTISADNPTAR